MVITLIGYRGSGKTTVAEALAARLGWSWIDADEEIERRAGRSIREIFADDGEPGFRRLEREATADLLQRDRLVLAAGGGAVVDEQTHAAVQAAGPVVWLRAAPESLLQRIDADPTTASRRPRLTDRDSRREIEELLAERTPIYARCASITIDTDDLPVREIVDRILHELPAAVAGTESEAGGKRG